MGGGPPGAHSGRRSQNGPIASGKGRPTAPPPSALDGPKEIGHLTPPTAHCARDAPRVGISVRREKGRRRAEPRYQAGRSKRALRGAACGSSRPGSSLNSQRRARIRQPNDAAGLERSRLRQCDENAQSPFLHARILPLVGRGKRALHLQENGLPDKWARRQWCAAHFWEPC